MAFGVAQSTAVPAFPPSTNPAAPATKAEISAAAGGSVTMGELFQPHTGVWPAVDATNGPLKVNSAITNTAPSFTGMTFVPWNKVGAFNKQSQLWAAVPTSNGPTANQCCQNSTTNRGNNYASTGLKFPAPIDTWFIADTAKIIVQYWVTTTHAANQGVSTPNHEVHLFAEHDSQMKSITQMPAVWPHASGGGNQMFYKSYEFSQALRKGFRLMLSAGCWLAGIWVDTGAKVNAGPNKPILFAGHGDSWAEPVGNVWASVGGNGSQAGVTWPTGCSLLMSNTIIQLCIATGMAGMPENQGGTGWFNQGPSGEPNVDLAGIVNFTPFCSTSQVDYWSFTYGPESSVNRYSIPFIGGGYNDGAGYSTATYKAQVLKGLNKFVAKDPSAPIIVQGIQCKSITPGGGYDLANTGIKQACADVPNVIGFIDDIADYAYVDMWSADLGPDGLHPTVKGGNNIGQNRAKKMAAMKIPRSRVLAAMAANIV